jgi:transposase
LHETTIGRILKRYKVTPQKPIRKAYQQKEIEVEYFCNVKFPEILERAKNEGEIIFWLDESFIKSDPNNCHTWGKIGRTPVIPANGNPEKINVIGSIDQNGEILFMTYEGNTDSEVVIKYLDMLAKSKKDKIYLILDNAKYHKSNIIKEHVSKYHKGWLELIYLPSYSPELNPCELMWAHLKFHGINRLVTKTKSEFHSAVELHLKKFGNEPILFKSFFGKNELRFIDCWQQSKSAEI